MQLSEEQIKEIAETCSDGTDDLMESTWSINAMIKFAHAIEGALRGPADARPAFYAADDFESPIKNSNGCCRIFVSNESFTGCSKAFYTYPIDAAAPGLSDADLRYVQRVLESDTPPEDRQRARDLIVKTRLSRASVATVAEPSKYPLAQGYQSYGDGGDCEQAKPVPYDGLAEQFSDEVSRLANDAPGIREAVAVALGHCGAIIAPAEQQAKPGAGVAADDLPTLTGALGTFEFGIQWDGIGEPSFMIVNGHFMGGSGFLTYPRMLQSVAKFVQDYAVTYDARNPIAVATMPKQQEGGK